MIKPTVKKPSSPIPLFMQAPNETFGKICRRNERLRVLIKSTTHDLALQNNKPMFVEGIKI